MTKVNEAKVELKALLRAGDYGKTEHIIITLTGEPSKDEETGDMLLTDLINMCKRHANATVRARHAIETPPREMDVKLPEDKERTACTRDPEGKEPVKKP